MPCAYDINLIINNMIQGSIQKYVCKLSTVTVLVINIDNPNTRRLVMLSKINSRYSEVNLR